MSWFGLTETPLDPVAVQDAPMRWPPCHVDQSRLIYLRYRHLLRHQQPGMSFVLYINGLGATPASFVCFPGLTSQDDAREFRRLVLPYIRKKANFDHPIENQLMSCLSIALSNKKNSRPRYPDAASPSGFHGFVHAGYGPIQIREFKEQFGLERSL